VRRRLGAVDEDERACRVGHLDDLADGVDRPERVADMGEGDDLGLQAQEDLEHVETEDAVVRDRDELQVAVLLLDEELPRNEVRRDAPSRSGRSRRPGRCCGGPSCRQRGLIASVALRVKTISWASGALMNRATRIRASS